MNRNLCVLLSALLVFFSSGAFAQSNVSVSNAAELASALAQAYANSVANPLAANTITLTANISATSQMIVDANLSIVGGGFTLDMNSADRAFFIAGGNVSISNLTIQNGYAKGGDNGSGGGGGAGLGGAIFVGSGVYSGAVDPVSGTASVAALGISAPAVTLSGVSFQNNQAVGGNSTVNDLTQGGGGGMGGKGGNTDGNLNNTSGMGGGGFGTGSDGAGVGTASGVNGAFVNVTIPVGQSTSGGSGGNGSASGSSGDGTSGGLNGGGGGQGGAGIEADGSGGGGGVGGGRGYYANGTPPTGGGNGGFGGGGGGAAYSYGGGGNGGFGGGGGNSPSFNGGNGGFGGGGGGYSDDSYNYGAGGFGGGRGSFLSKASPGSGGGGMGAGGAVFVMAGASLSIQDGSFASNTVTAGTAYVNGSAYGADLFLGANVTLNVSSALTVNSLGGAGNLADANVANNANDPNAQGGLIKTGAGTLTLTGTNYYTGNTTVNSGTLTLGAGALEKGTGVVTVGQNPGDNATLHLGSSSNLTLGGFSPTAGTDAPLMIAQDAGSIGSVVIGSGPGSSGADIGARVFTGGSGTASVVFTQQYAAGSSTDSVYPFYITLTGSLGVVQSGMGTTSLQPRFGANAFTGPIVIQSGILQIGSATALPAGNALTLDGGTLQTAMSLEQTFGAVSVEAVSLLDLAGNSAFTFGTLNLGATLTVWNYTPEDTIIVSSGTVTGSLTQIAFYSGNGQTFLGTGKLSGNNIVPVPESSWVGPGLAALLIFAAVRRKQRMRRLVAGASSL